MKLSKKDIENLASLSKINLTEKELDKFTSDMQTIISSVETLENFEEKTGHCTRDVKFDEIDFKELREDEIDKSMTQEDALANAPHKENGYFKVFGEIFDENSS